MTGDNFSTEDRRKPPEFNWSAWFPTTDESWIQTTPPPSWFCHSVPSLMLSPLDREELANKLWFLTGNYLKANAQWNPGHMWIQKKKERNRKQGREGGKRQEKEFLLWKDWEQFKMNFSPQNYALNLNDRQCRFVMKNRETNILNPM